MKQIELTEEHKTKLLEMCEVLFPEPEYSFWWEYEMYGRGLKQSFNDVLCVCHTFKKPIIKLYNGKEFKQTSNYFNIHWFEFCMTHLVDKIDNLWIKHVNYKCVGYDTTSYDWTNRPFLKIWNIVNTGHLKQHPVDYLYEEFKKLNKDIEPESL